RPRSNGLVPRDRPQHGSTAAISLDPPRWGASAPILQRRCVARDPRRRSDFYDARPAALALQLIKHRPANLPAVAPLGDRPSSNIGRKYCSQRSYLSPIKIAGPAWRKSALRRQEQNSNTVLFWVCVAAGQVRTTLIAPCALSVFVRKSAFFIAS